MALVKGTPASSSSVADTSLTLAFTQMAGSNRKLLVGISLSGAGSTFAGIPQAQPDGCYIDTTATPLVLVGGVTSGDLSKVYLFELNNASTGTINFNLDTGNCDIVMGYLEWSGADQSALGLTTNTGSSTSQTITVSGTNSNDMILAVFSHYNAENPPHTLGGGQTSEWDVTIPTNKGAGTGSTKASGASVVQTSDCINTRTWAAAAVNIVTFAAPASPAVMWLFS